VQFEPSPFRSNSLARPDVRREQFQFVSFAAESAGHFAEAGFKVGRFAGRNAEDEARAARTLGGAFNSSAVIPAAIPEMYNTGACNAHRLPRRRGAGKIEFLRSHHAGQPCVREGFDQIADIVGMRFQSRPAISRDAAQPRPYFSY